MKKINDLTKKIADKVKEMELLTAEETMTDEQVRSWEDISEEVSRMQKELDILKKTEEFNKSIAQNLLRNEDDGEQRSLTNDFFSAAREYVRTGGRMISREFMGNNEGLVIPDQLFNRAAPNDILTSQDSNSLQERVVRNDLSLVTGDDFSLLSALGVEFLPGLKGIIALPYMGQITASTAAEQNDVSTAGADPKTVMIEPIATGSSQIWTKQALLTMPDSIYTSIINDMQLANERLVVTSLMNKILATDTSIAATASGLSYGDMINLTKINYNIGPAAFVTGNDVRVYLEQKPVNTAGIALAWNALNNTIGGRRAISTDTLSDKQAIYGNFAYSAVGIWGTPELIVNPYEYDTSGQLKVTVMGFYDTAVRNKYAFNHFSADASVSI